MPDQPPGFARWDNPTHTVAVDSYGRRWWRNQRADGTRGWMLAPLDGLTGQAREEHQRGTEAAEQDQHSSSPTNGGTPMSRPTANPELRPSEEVTGIRSAVAQLDAIAAAHRSHAGDEGFLGSLNDMQVGEPDKQAFLAAQEASRNAGAAWALAARTVREHNLPVHEAYQQSPGAGNKQSHTNE